MKTLKTRKEEQEKVTMTETSAAALSKVLILLLGPALLSLFPFSPAYMSRKI